MTERVSDERLEELVQMYSPRNLELGVNEWRLRYELAKTYDHLPWCGRCKWDPHDERCHCIRPRCNQVQS